MAVTPESIMKDLYITRDMKKGYCVFLEERHRCYTGNRRIGRLRLPGACGAVVFRETPEMREELPEEYRGEEYECITLYARHELTEGRTVAEDIYEEADLLYDSGKLPWKVVRTESWRGYGTGGIHKALAVRRRDGKAAAREKSDSYRAAGS